MIKNIRKLYELDLPDYDLTGLLKANTLENKPVVIFYESPLNVIHGFIHDRQLWKFQNEIKEKFKNNKVGHTKYFIMFSNDWQFFKKNVNNKLTNKNLFNDLLKNNYWFSEINYDGTFKINHPELFSLYTKLKNDEPYICLNKRYIYANENRLKHSIFILYKNIDNCVGCDLNELEYIDFQNQIKHFFKNENMHTDYFAIDGNKFFDILNWILQYHKYDWEDFVEKHTIPEIVNIVDPTIWYSEFKSNGYLETQKDLFNEFYKCPID